MLNTTGYTKKTPLRYMVDAGAIYLNLQLDETGTYVSGNNIGATSGGNQFRLEQNFRQVEVDGLKGAGKGNEVLQEENAFITVNLKEMTAENLALAIAGSKKTNVNAYYESIKSKGSIELSDYIDNIALVGRQTGTNKPIIIFIYNALNMQGIDLQTQDDSEVVLALEFKAHYGEDNVNLGEGPFEIMWPKEEGSVTGIVTDGTDPVEGATVTLTIEGTDTATDTTDQTGAYVLTDIPFGTYTVSAESSDGLTTGTVADVIVLGGETTENVDITLA